MSKVKEAMDGQFFNYRDRSTDSKIGKQELVFPLRNTVSTADERELQLWFTSLLMNDSPHTRIILYFWYLKPIKASSSLTCESAFPFLPYAHLPG